MHPWVGRAPLASWLQTMPAFWPPQVCQDLLKPASVYQHVGFRVADVQRERESALVMLLQKPRLGVVFLTAWGSVGGVCLWLGNDSRSESARRGTFICKANCLLYPLIEPLMAQAGLGDTTSLSGEKQGKRIPGLAWPLPH